MTGVRDERERARQRERKTERAREKEGGWKRCDNSIVSQNVTEESVPSALFPGFQHLTGQARLQRPHRNTEPIILIQRKTALSPALSAPQHSVLGCTNT